MTTGNMFEVHDKLRFDDYRKLPGLHASSLKHALTSPLAYHHAETKGWPDSDAFVRGRSIHTAVLEPQRFLSEYAQWETEREDGSKRIRRGKEWDEFCAVNAGKTILTPEQYESAIALRDVVRDHPVAGPLVKRVGQSELSLRWKHERTGADCKARLDRVSAHALIDIKSTTDPSPAAFGNVAARLKYLLQCALYRDGAEACGLGRLPFKIVAVSSKAPFDVVVYDVGDDLLAEGQEQYERAIDIVLECRERQEWPGQAVDHELPLLLPMWAMSSGDDEPVTFGEEAIG